MARGKRVEIVKVQVMGPDGPPIEVDGKACTKCGEVKALEEFPLQKRYVDGRDSECKECKRLRTRLRRNERRSTEGRRSRTKWTTSTLRERVHEITKGEYLLVGYYLGAQVETEILHTACGEKWPVRPNLFINFGSRCPHCSPKIVAKMRAINQNWTTEGYIADVFALVGDEYTVVGKYVDSRKHIKMRHNICGNEWSPRPTDFTSRGRRCPYCCESHGEITIRKYLTHRGFAFTSQETFEDLRAIDRLRFDFSIRILDRTILIEYDGEQHFHPVDFAGKGELWALEQFHETQRRDRIKDDYCRANGIDLIRIRYDQFDEIETILERRLSALGVTGSHPTEEIANITKEAA
ncbi:hypothetical protein BSK66_07685 [Paenibacillus odorifer]|uniref:Uncharacterized protein n=1 Tax=Paenibacillus odorifer TaxID=189426 RepID=A0A1R0X2N0_9BACL|nr:hypothetical protein [Paenibacillus odorifer]ETT64883.1 hypothetical protein C171_07702 [Paenibacillus sp. FSL H8-237]OMD27440.1 hypothetical protein BJP51_24915 [Paenibacillus odorifer]OME61002.1 hypothetical protein BSK66_07685 [Paenibacillus odorifer]